MAFKLCNSNLIVNTLGQDLWIQQYLNTTISIIIIKLLPCSYTSTTHEPPEHQTIEVE